MSGTAGSGTAGSGHAPRAVHHVQLGCPPGGEDAARGFYGGLLGMTELAKPAALAARGGVWFRSGQVELHLGVDDGFAPSRKAHPGLLLASTGALERLAAALAAAGHPVAWDTHLPGHPRLYTADPHGNRLELLAAA